MALATVADLEVRLGAAPGSLSGADLARAQAALDDASALIEQEAGQTWATPPAPVRVVCVQAALRVYRNPEGFTGESYGGDYSWQGREAGLYLTDSERDIITRAATGGWLGTVRTPSGYAATVDGGDAL